MNTLLVFFIIVTCNFNVELIFEQGIFQVGSFLNILDRYILTKGFILIEKVCLLKKESNKCLTFVWVTLIGKIILQEINKIPKKIISCQTNLLFKTILLLSWLYFITLSYSILISIKILLFLYKIIIKLFNIGYCNYNYIILKLKSQEDYDLLDLKNFDLLKHLSVVNTVNSISIGIMYTLFYTQFIKSGKMNLLIFSCYFLAIVTTLLVLSGINQSWKLIILCHPELNIKKSRIKLFLIKIFALIAIWGLCFFNHDSIVSQNKNTIIKKEEIQKIEEQTNIIEEQNRLIREQNKEIQEQNNLKAKELNIRERELILKEKELN